MDRCCIRNLQNNKIEINGELFGYPRKTHILQINDLQDVFSTQSRDRTGTPCGIGV